jgi:hypothetical protein
VVGTQRIEHNQEHWGTLLGPIDLFGHQAIQVLLLRRLGCLQGECRVIELIGAAHDMPRKAAKSCRNYAHNNAP